MLSLMALHLAASFACPVDSSSRSPPARNDTVARTRSAVGDFPLAGCEPNPGSLSLSHCPRAPVDTPTIRTTAPAMATKVRFIGRPPLLWMPRRRHALHCQPVLPH